MINVKKINNHTLDLPNPVTANTQDYCNLNQFKYMILLTLHLASVAEWRVDPNHAGCDEVGYPHNKMCGACSVFGNLYPPRQRPPPHRMEKTVTLPIQNLGAITMNFIYER